MSTGAEATRWFGITMPCALYSAQVFTSVENDWGFGVSPIPSLEGNQHWVRLLVSQGVIGLIVFAVIVITFVHSRTVFILGGHRSVE